MALEIFLERWGRKEIKEVTIHEIPRVLLSTVGSDGLQVPFGNSPSLQDA